MSHLLFNFKALPLELGVIYDLIVVNNYDFKHKIIIIIDKYDFKKYFDHPPRKFR